MTTLKDCWGPLLDVANRVALQSPPHQLRSYSATFFSRNGLRRTLLEQMDSQPDSGHTWALVRETHTSGIGFRPAFPG